MEICFTPARQLARLIRARKLSATEVVNAFIAQIERVNPKVNAIVTFTPELALKKAKSADRGKPLAGLPIAYKDMVPTKDVRTTFGSIIYRDHVPTEDHAIVERLTAAGAILIGKTNTPEFGAGSQTFNKLFGATRNPYDPSKTWAAPRAAPARRWRAACCPSPTAQTSRRACAIPATTATSSASGPRRGECRRGPRRMPGSRWR